MTNMAPDELYAQHLRNICDAFNDEADELDLPVRLCPNRCITGLEHGFGLCNAYEFANRSDESGVVHDNQIRTLAMVMGQLIEDPTRAGVILGGMQCGKTGLSLSLQWLGPAMYLLTGLKLYIFYILTNQKSHEDQTDIELKRFLRYYGELDVRIHQNRVITLNQFQSQIQTNPVFQRTPTLNTYRRLYISNNATLVDSLSGENILHRRVRGKAVQRIAEQCRLAETAGLIPVCVIDEPQYGAKDHSVNGDTRSCVLRRIFTAIEQEVGTTSRFVMIGVSATPYELIGLESLWKVQMKLDPNYSGFNYFNGEIIDPDVNITPPQVLDFTEFELGFGVPNFSSINFHAYGDANKFQSWASRNHFSGSHDEYQDMVNTALRRAILNIIANGSPTPNRTPRGICMRALNHNGGTENLIRNLALEQIGIDIIRYFGGNHGSVKRLIANRQYPDRPFVVFVTNGARMADAFPPAVTHFFEFSKRSSDLNSLLQGLLGRACGYNKNSTVIMSLENVAILRQYVATDGTPNYRTSRASIVLGSVPRQPAARPVLLIQREDPTLPEAFAHLFEKIQNEIVGPITRGPAKTIRGALRPVRGGRFTKLPQIFEELRLHEQLIQHGQQLFPSIAGPIVPIRPNERVADNRQPGGYSIWEVNDEQECQVLFRKEEAGASRSGRAGRGRGSRDGQAGLEREYGLIQPTIGLRKVDDEGVLIGDKSEPGHWVPVEIAIPLHHAIRQLPNTATRRIRLVYPVSESPYSDFMTDAELVLRDNQSQ